MDKSVFTLLGIGMGMLMCATPASASDSHWYPVGAPITSFSKLVPNPDVSIHYVMFDPATQVATLSVRPVDCTDKEMLSIDVKVGDIKQIAIKHDCDAGNCKVYILQIAGNTISDDGSIRLDEEITVNPSYSN